MLFSVRIDGLKQGGWIVFIKLSQILVLDWKLQLNQLIDLPIQPIIKEKNRRIDNPKPTSHHNNDPRFKCNIQEWFQNNLFFFLKSVVLNDQKTSLYMLRKIVKIVWYFNEISLNKLKTVW